MEREHLTKWGLLILTLVLLYFSYRILAPYIITILLALVTVFLLHPIYKKLAGAIKREHVASLLMLVLILLIIVIPTGFFLTKIVKESVSAYRLFVNSNVTFESMPIISELSPSTRETLQGSIDQIASNAKDYMVLVAPNIFGEVAAIVLNLLIFFFVLYFGFVNGPGWFNLLREHLPLSSELRNALIEDIENGTSAIIYGQLLTALIQGALGGLMFLIFGIPNPIFWGFVMVIFSFIPFLGTPLIFVPAALLELLAHNYVAGIGVLIVGFGLVVNVDNFIRPYFVSKFSKIHPLVVILGVFGGLEFFGFSGIILGPLILTLFITLIRGLLRHDPEQHEITDYAPVKKRSKRAA